MTNNPIPAALASIKRYSIVYGGEFTQPRFVLVEDREGEVMKAADVIATLPPPADVANILFPPGFVERVASAMAANGWATGGDDQEFIDDLKSSFEIAEAEWAISLAAPPADSAMELREASYKCIDMAQSLELVSTEGMSNFGKHKIAKSIELFKELGTLLAGRK